MGVAEPPARWKEKSGRVASFFRAGGKPTPVFTLDNSRHKNSSDSSKFGKNSDEPEGIGTDIHTPYELRYTQNDNMIHTSLFNSYVS